jgi:hypothetical protein
MTVRRAMGGVAVSAADARSNLSPTPRTVDHILVIDFSPAFAAATGSGSERHSHADLLRRSP